MSAPMIASALRVSRILFGALLASIASYVVIANVVTSKPGKTSMPALADAPTSHPVFIALCVGSAIELLIALVVRKKLMPSRTRTNEGFRGIREALTRLRVTELIGWVLCEAVAINGLVLTMLSRNTQFVYAFSAVGALGMLLQVPSRKLIDDIVQSAAPD